MKPRSAGYVRRRDRMHALSRLTRILATLLMVVVVMAAVAFMRGQVAGNRIFLLNSTNCRIEVMEEHDGSVAQPGETVLVKPGFIKRTPTMLIASGSHSWFGGLHFAEDKLQVHGRDDIIIPLSWRETSLFGTRLTYELTAQGQLVVYSAGNKLPGPQPSGLPLQGRHMNTCAPG